MFPVERYNCGYILVKTRSGWLQQSLTMLSVAQNLQQLQLLSWAAAFPLTGIRCDDSWPVCLYVLSRWHCFHVDSVCGFGGNEEFVPELYTFLFFGIQ